MLEVYHFNEAEIILFALALVRVSAMFVTMPIVGVKLVPGPVKILLSIAVVFVLFPFLHSVTTLPGGWKDILISLIVREAFLGVFMGFLCRMIFMSVEIAGQILSFTVGLSAAQLVNPSFGESSSVMEQFETVLATLLFLAINGHHMFFEALYRSFELAPLGVLSVKAESMKSVLLMTKEIFEIGVKLAGPMIAVILFLNIAMGVVGRAVPQINVFVISFPVNILVGLFIFMVSIPLLLTVMESDFTNLGTQVMGFVKGF
jgi:flagellar biosynthetic protein FliR